MELLWEHHFLFISTMFYWTSAKLHEIFIFSISILWEYTLLELCHCILQVKIENNQVLQYCHGVTMGKPILFITTTFTGPVLSWIGYLFSAYQCCGRCPVHGIWSHSWSKQSSCTVLLLIYYSNNGFYFYSTNFIGLLLSMIRYLDSAY